MSAYSCGWAIAQSRTAWQQACQRPRAPAAGRGWVRASVALCVLTSIFFSPLHLGHFLRWPDARDAATNAAIASIPHAASVGTYDEIYAHLGFFPRATVGVRRDPQYVVYDERYVSAAWTQRIVPGVRRAIADGTYRVISRRDGIVLLARKS